MSTILTEATSDDIIDLSNTFPQENTSNSKLSKIFTCKILNLLEWPLKTETPAQIPPIITTLERSFCQEYFSKHDKRHLSFNYSHSSCELQVNYLSQKFLIETNQALGLILLRFNEVDEIDETENLKSYCKDL